MNNSQLESQSHIDLLQELVSIPSFVGLESRLVEVAGKKLESLNFRVIIKTSDPDNWQNDAQGSPPLFSQYSQPKYLIAYPPIERDSGLLLFAHYDTERLAENEANLAFSVREEDSKYFGRGIADDKAGVAVIFLALENLVANTGQKLPAVVLAQAKHGGCYGMSEAIASLENRTAAIYCHPAESNQGFSQIKVASRGIATFELEFTGLLPEPTEENTPASADPRTGQSAISIGSKFIAEVEKWDDPSIVWLVSEVSSTGRDYQVPESCRMRISTWFKDLELKEIESLLNTRLAVFSKNSKYSIKHKPEITGIRANPAVTEDKSFIEKVRSTISKYSGESVSDYEWHAASDIRFPLLHLGIPTVGFGCLAGGFYGGDEWIDQESFKQFVQIISDLAKSY